MQAQIQSQFATIIQPQLSQLSSQINSLTTINTTSLSQQTAQLHNSMQTYFDSASASRATENDRSIAQMSATQQQLYQNFQTNHNTHMQDTQHKLINAVQSAVQSQNETHLQTHIQLLTEQLALVQNRLQYTEQSREDERNFLMQWMMMCTQNSMGIPGPALQMPAQRTLHAPERTPIVSGRSALLATANDHAAISPSDNAKLSLSAQQQHIQSPAHSQLPGQPQPLHTSLPTHHTSRLNFQQPVQTPLQQHRGTGLNSNLFSNQRVASETRDSSQMYINTPSPQTTAMPSAVHHSSVHSQYSN
jgi:hypothetical protein